MRPVLFLYSLFLALISPFAFAAGLVIAKKRGESEGFGERFGLVKLNRAPRNYSVWFHCASVGEVRSVKDIVDILRERYPEISVIISTMTVTGREEARDYVKADEAFLLPIENAPAISHLIKLLGVKVFFIVDTEIWPALIWTAGSSSAGLVMINGRISAKTFKIYRSGRFFFGPILKKFSCILAKSPEDAKRFATVMGTDKTVAAAGNIKFQKPKDKKNYPPLPAFAGLKYILFASTHDPEERTLLSWMKEETDKYDKIIIAPRHPSRSEAIKKSAEKAGFAAALYSGKKSFESEKVVIINSFGLMENLYAGASKIFIGGSLERTGGHNLYEALQFEKRVATGPFMDNFSEIFSDAVSSGVASVIKNKEDFLSWLRKDEKETERLFEDFFRKTEEKNLRTSETVLSVADAFLGKQEGEEAGEKRL